jgi:LmbE family N-acetylglucosaminyl deacetylase
LAAKEMGVGTEDWDPDAPMDDGNPFGTPESEITWDIDVSDFLAQKRASLEAHRSQATDISQFLEMPPEIFSSFFGHEYLIEPGVDGPMREGWPF